MEDKCWAVIKFPNEKDAVSVVPTSWLRGNQCYWPPWSDAQINTAIQNGTPADVETWQVHPFTPLRNNVFADYQSAKQKLGQATVTSDLESMPVQSKTGTSIKRKITKTVLTKFASFELESDVDEKDPSETNLPKPPKPGKASKKSKQDNINPEIILSDRGRDHHHHRENDDRTSIILSDITKKLDDFRKNDSSPDPYCSDFIDDREKYESPSCSKTQNKKNKKLEKNKPETLNSERADSMPAQIQAPTRSEHLYGDQQNSVVDYLKKIIRKQNVLQSTLADLADDITEIKRKVTVNPSTELINDNSRSIYITMNLPVDTEIDLQNLEEELSNTEAMNDAVQEVGSLGGKDVYELIYRTTQKLITNKLAAKYSYFGRRKKLKFSTLKINELLKKVAVKSFNCTQKEAEVAIAKWLRRCAERAMKE